MFSGLLYVCVGSAVGGGLRFLVGRLMSGWSYLPWGTFVVNILGCFLIGLFGTMMSSEGNANTRLLLTTGFCGGFTTFSTFVSESSTLATGEHGVLMAAAYVATSVFVGVLAYAGGCAIGRMT